MWRCGDEASSHKRDIGDQVLSGFLSDRAGATGAQRATSKLNRQRRLHHTAACVPYKTPMPRLLTAGHRNVSPNRLPIG
jgi:hypothetical protein